MNEVRTPFVARKKTCCSDTITMHETEKKWHDVKN